MKILLIISLLFSSACVTTRSRIKQQEEKQKLEENLQDLQTGKANLETQFSDIQEEFRSLNGRIEVVENQNNQSAEQKVAEKEEEDKKWADFSNRFELLFESMNSMQEKMDKMGASLVALEAKVKKLATKKAKPVAKKKARKKKGNYTQAEIDFSNKKWQEAALGYQKYRELNPNGKRYARATFRMGVCFQNLSFKDDAKVFYEEVIAKYPKGKYASLARDNLKKLK